MLRATPRRTVRALATAVAVLVATVSLGGTADAQEPEPTPSADESEPTPSADESEPAIEARAAFEAGTAALRDGHYDEAVVQLTRSHDLLPNVANAFNLAVALLRAGRPRESLALLRALEDDLHGPLSEEQRTAIDQRIAETLSRVAQLDVVVERVPGDDGGPARAILEVDGAEIAELEIGPGGSRTRRVELDPGDHTIAVRAPRYAPATRSVAVTAGSSSVTSFVLAPEVAVAVTPPQQPPEGGVDETALWVGLIAGAVALAAGGITLGVWLDEPRLVVDPETGIGETLLAAGVSF
jgi:hypothetical protein